MTVHYYFQCDDSGEILSVSRSDVAPDSLTSDAKIVETDADTYAKLRKARGAYVLNGEVCYRPTMPSPYHYWDTAHKAWVLNEAAQYEEESLSVRTRRTQLLLDSDWTDTLSAQTRLGETLYAQWQTYRQALRDITQQPGFPLDVIWPTPPT